MRFLGLRGFSAFAVTEAGSGMALTSPPFSATTVIVRQQRPHSQK